MGTRDPRIDAYIAKSAGFARPILEHLRATVHEACPDVEETMKWSMPTFVHAGGILAGMAAFKQHASFGYWKHALVMGEDAPQGGRPGEGRPKEGRPKEGRPKEGMGSYGRMASLEDLPSKKQLVADIRRAAKLNEDGVKAPAVRKSAPKPVSEMPADFGAALAKDGRAKAAFDAFPPSSRREYAEWITEAKREATRTARITQAVEWIAEGKRRHWKYERR